MRVRSAALRDLDRVIALWPDLPGANVPLDAIFVAENDGDVVGAAGFSQSPYGDRIYGLRGNIFVRPDSRGGGIGSALLRTLAAEVQAWGVDRLYAWKPTSDAETQARLRSWGFEPAYHVYTFEITSQPTLRALAPMLERLRSRGRIPSDLIIAPLRDLDPAAASSLYAQFYALPLDVARARLIHLLGDEVFSGRYSLGIVQDDVLQGILVWDGGGGLPSVDLLAVSPSWKAAWGPLLLLYESVHRFDRDGHTRAIYKCTDAVTFSLQIARLGGARQIDDAVSYVLNLADAPCRHCDRGPGLGAVLRSA